MTQWRAGLRALSRIFGIKANHDQVFEAVVAFGYPTLQREFDKLVATPEGRRLIREKPDLMAYLGDDT